MNGWTYYQTPELAVVPYMPGTPVYRDEMMVELYHRTKTEGRMEQVFCGDDMNLDSFVTFFEKRKTMQVLCRVKNNRDLTLAGYCWVDLPRGVDGAKAAMAGFCFFRNAARVAVDLGRLGLAYWFEDLRIDVLHGVLLEQNKAGAHYARLLGFRDVGVVPLYHYYRGELTGARVMYLTKRDFYPGFEEWFANANPVEIPA